ncbi:hypothetical protein LDENG_00256780 [Lucifuga dentata]|nr:hypothetical protein LDENG_00256780 [Lucifuga dentata]
MSVLIDSRDAGSRSATDPNPGSTEVENKSDSEKKGKQDGGFGKGAEDDAEGRYDLSSLSALNAKSKDELHSQDKSQRAVAQPEESKTTSPHEEVHRAVNYMSRSESDDYEDEDDDVSLVLSDDCVPCATEDESHYITTHEIQLSELSDHEEGYDLGVGSSSWDIEDDNQVYSFVDYASFDGDEAVGERGDGQVGSPGTAAAVSTLLENDLCDAAKFSSSDESVSKIQQQRHAGQIHLSIRTTSRAINDPSNIQEKENVPYDDKHSRRSGDMSRYVLRGADGKAEKLCGSAQSFIAAPGRSHKARSKAVAEGSSGESSAVSELDDADKEVRNLTARAFKSLAYPYLDAINFNTSSESSASERGLGINRWSTFVDLKYGNVNMSQGLDQSVISHKNATASFEIAKNIDNKCYKGSALASIKPPTSKIFTLSGNPHGAASSTQKIELRGKFAQGHSGVIRLTETLNFRCNVKSEMSGGERRPKFAQNASGSRSTDEVTSSLLSSHRRGARKPLCKSMEDTHKKAIFASSLIKNVISKKMQFEQERKMERGEISEPHPTPSPSSVQQEGESHRGKGSRELRRQSSRFSETSSDNAVVCVDELGDILASGSCDTKSDCRRQDTLTSTPETNLEPTNEAGIDTKKGALEASKSTLLRSQNSAFRCWKDDELEFQKDHKNDKTPEGKLPPANDKEGEEDPSSAGSSKLTKMSHLFVPNIQMLPSDAQQQRSRDSSPCAGIKLRSDNNFYIADSRRVATSKSPEIKINLRSVRESKPEPVGVSRLRAPNAIRADDFKCQALAAVLKGESSERVPHFMVRDIRDNKGKLQTPIHQVRDVRKLVKSSYHFVSLDNNDSKSGFAAADTNPEQKKQIPHRIPTSVSPIVIQCQSVNTNNNGKQSGDLVEVSKQGLDEDALDSDRSSPEGAASGSELQKPPGRAATGNNSTEAGAELRNETRIASMRQEKMSEMADKKAESKMSNQAALEKLQAAVKTMEQLYVFDRNEWKRKSEPQLLTGSHVLSLITREEQGGLEEKGVHSSKMDKSISRDSYPNTDKTLPVVAAITGADMMLRREDRDPKAVQTASSHDDRFLKSLSLQAASTNAKTPQPNAITHTPFSNKVPNSPKLPLSLKISQAKREGVEVKEVERSTQNLLSTSADNENYLTIPVKPHTSTNKQASSLYTVTTQSHPTTPPRNVGPSSTKAQEDNHQAPKRSSIVMETRSPEIPSATIYHSLPLSMSVNQPQVYCFSPTIKPAPTLDPFQATQRKMLLDPTTGNYYLVDTPVQPATKRLFDPETGQYVEVPMPQPPMTPLPLPISPLALGHTYMLYPGFLPTPSSQMSVQPEAEMGEKALSQQTEGMYMESPFYMATGKSLQAVCHQHTASRPTQGFSTQPIISITSQQGPRIIAPPSFDGTTMSFVVEHR